MDEQDKKAITSLVYKMVMGRIEKGEVDPNDDEALKKAAKEAAPIARSAYFAALEFLR